MDGPTPNPLAYEQAAPNRGKAWIRQAIFWIGLIVLMMIVLLWAPAVLHRFEVLAWQGQLEDWEFDPVKPIKTSTVIVQPGPNRWPAYRAEALGSASKQGTLVYCHEVRTAAGEKRLASVEFSLASTFKDGSEIYLVSAILIRPAKVFTKPSQAAHRWDMLKVGKFVSLQPAKVISKDLLTLRLEVKFEDRVDTIDVTFDSDQTPKIERVKP